MGNKKNSYAGTVESIDFGQRTEIDAEYTVENLQVEEWDDLGSQNTVPYYGTDSSTSGTYSQHDYSTSPQPEYNPNVLEKLSNDDLSNPFDNKWSSVSSSSSSSSSSSGAKLDLEENWEEDAWMERWRSNPEKYLVAPLPPELSQRLEEALRETKMKRTDFVLKALEQACERAELDRIRRKGKAEGEPAKLIKDPQTGKYRCFPADFFTEDELYGLEVIDGKYYHKRWEKTDKGWVEVNKGYFEATGDQDAPYIKMVNNKPVGNWEVYPFEFFEHDWKWGIYDNEHVVIEVVGRREEDAELWLDVYVDNKKVKSVKTSREVHRIIMDHIR
ncbi:hypothetical protein [Staphylospora marina]|uniref:hypothetical protein n=1 Tax=Staphylospora marina TaxID=2490858 RepID=UPI000F5C1AB1|nr:hypothetical protein [Staphylospora marina]